MAQPGRMNERLQACPARLVTLASFVALCACAVGPNFHRPAAPPAADYGKAPVSGDTSAADAAEADLRGGGVQHFVSSMDIPGQWWTLFQSDELDQLVVKALKANPNVDAAKAALRQAHELYASQRAAFFPSVQGSFSGTRAKNPLGTLANPTSLPQQNPYYDLYAAQVSVSYLPDVFGGTRRAVEAARAQEENNRFQLEAVYLTLSSNVVVSALQEASLRAQISATERLVELEHQQTDIVQHQQTLGTASQLDLLSQQTTEAQVVETLPPLRKQLAQTRDQLTALLGRLPSDEPPQQFTLDKLTLPTDIPVSLPSKLIEQRPDVRQAEATMHITSAEVGVALANMLPQFEIDAAAGSSALAVHDLFGPYTGFWSVGGSLTQTLFDAGALLHRKRAADAALDQAAAEYRATVILACQNVADTLHALQTDADALVASAQAQRAAKRSFDLARAQFQLGAVSNVAVLNTEQAYLQTELTLVQAQVSRYSDTAALFQALGGGWWNRPEDFKK
jgi:NodT family efflux transporter outer membrane factor (OMF) lipoprotein